MQTGGRILQETRRWDDDRGESTAMRSKEDAHDYRYFPDPDLVPIVTDEEILETVRQSLPALPEARIRQYTSQYSLSAYDAAMIASVRSLADFYEEAVRDGAAPKTAANWIMGELMRLRNDSADPDAPLTFPGTYLAELIRRIEAGEVSSIAAKQVFRRMYESGKAPGEIIREEDLGAVGDSEALETAIRKIMASHPDIVADIMNGKDKAMGYLMGQVMKELKGRADPRKVSQLLKEAVDRSRLPG
jgi:aspartyl-tRNA(Asn)/glutamyl-tRNA(Gln) amidotransferase subunit B